MNETCSCGHLRPRGEFCATCYPEITGPPTSCATCGKRLPAEPDPRVVTYCSAWCYGREVAAVPIVRIYPTA